jgi:AraC-like DNA-binding protein
MEKVDLDTYRWPHPLSSIIKSCWLMRSYGASPQQVPDLLIPDGCPELIVVYRGGYCKTRLNQPAQKREIRSSCLVGLQTDTQLVQRVGEVHILGFKFQPLGFYRLFPDQAAQMVNQNCPVSQPWLQALEEALSKADQIKAVAEISTPFFEQQLRQSPSSIGLSVTASALEDMKASLGQKPIREFARQQHRSIRQLQRYFKRYIGLTPKQMASIYRFKALYRESVIHRIQPQDYFQYGYFDQTHFIKDFKQHLGITPTQVQRQDFQLKNEIARRSRGK